jgi:hypothetical protein
MNAVVFEHVPVADLPEAWRARLATDGGALVTVRIEAEAQPVGSEAFVTDDPAFGMWRDREDMADVPAYVREIRKPRLNADGWRNGIPQLSQGKGQQAVTLGLVNQLRDEAP